MKKTKKYTCAIAYFSKEKRKRISKSQINKIKTQKTEWKIKKKSSIETCN